MTSTSLEEKLPTKRDYLIKNGRLIPVGKH